MTNAPQNESERLEAVQSAVRQVLEDLRGELESYRLVLFPDRVEFSYGGWLVPAEVHASEQARKSYELHRLIEKLEDLLHELTASTVTIDLRSAA